MTDQLTADVERWLAAEVRTTWPGKSGDCCDAGERADMARWFAAQVTAFEAWRAANHGGIMNTLRARIWPYVPTDPKGMAQAQAAWTASLNDADAAVCPVTASEPPNSTRTAQDTNRSAQSDVVSTLLEAATAAAQARTLPPPKPGTHESDLIDPERKYWRAGLNATNNVGLWAGGSDECDAAQTWSTANRQENA